MTLEDMIKLAESQARTVLIGTKAELTPMWLILDWKGEIEIVATPWNSPHQKHVVTAAMRETMRETGIIAYSLLVEAWFSRLSAKEAGKEYKGPPPSERADRQEAVVALACNRDGRTLYHNWEIKRDKKGRCIELLRLDGPEDRITSAIFDNLLDERKPS
jgi:hypothetical protein